MSREVLIGSDAVAYGAKLCDPEVIAAYPITPQSHITERLAKFVADGELKSEYVKVESEFSAISCVVGASAAGVRTFTATSSQGLALMHEVLFAASGMRLPIVMPVANRALSAPINIWNDWQDSISERDNGWLQLYCENNQEALDTTIQAYKIAEDNRVLLPTMVCLDGFYLTHTTEPVEVPTHEKVEKFIGKYKPEHAYLDPEKPMTQGPFAYPEPYYAMRKELAEAALNSKKVIEDVDKAFCKEFGRCYGILEKTRDADTLIVTMGSLVGNARLAAEQLDCGVLKMRLYRPFPKEELKKAVKGVKKLVVIEKDVSLGLGSGALYSEIRDTLYEMDDKPQVFGFMAGFGGKDIRISDVFKMVKSTEGKEPFSRWYP